MSNSDLDSDTIVTLKVARNMFKGGDIRLPKTVDHIFGTEKVKAKMIFDDEVYDVTVQSNKNLFVYGLSDYRMRAGAAFARKLQVFFAYTYAVTAFKKKAVHEENISFCVYKKDGMIYFEELCHVVYEDEQTPFLRSAISRGVIGDDFEISEDEETEDESGIKTKKGRAITLNLKKASDLVPKFSNMIPIEDLDKHICVKRCVYMWFSKDSKRMYIGSAKTLQSRLVQHRENTGNSDICIEKYGSSFTITHFAYLEFKPVVPMVIVRAIERIIIKSFSLFLPNHSNGINHRIPLDKSIEWKQVNNAY